MLEHLCLCLVWSTMTHWVMGESSCWRKEGNKGANKNELVSYLCISCERFELWVVVAINLFPLKWFVTISIHILRLIFIPGYQSTALPSSSTSTSSRPSRSTHQPHMQTCNMRLNHPNDELGKNCLLFMVCCFGVLLIVVERLYILFLVLVFLIYFLFDGFSPSLPLSRGHAPSDAAPDRHSRTRRL